MKKFTQFLSKYQNILAYSFFAFIVIILLGKNLNPLQPVMFDFHDETQPGRILDFAINLKNGIIPPRMAPTYSYNLGYPMFNFYAPFAYWITTIIHLLGLNILAALKVSFFLSIFGAFSFMFLFLRKHFSLFPSLLGAGLYAASPYFAVEIFIRGNLAETWFLALFPLGLYLMDNQKTKKNIFLTALVLSFLFSVHNVFSLLSLAILGVYATLLPQRKMNYLLIVCGLLISTYFLLPVITETKLTYAPDIAKQTDYKTHFLCPFQIWSSPWGYGGSGAGCTDDGMSFQIGKLQILLAIFGIGMLAFQMIIKKESWKKNLVPLFVLFLGSFALFLTTYLSQFLWTILEPILSLFQFSWRFLVFGMFGTAFFAAYGMDKFHLPIAKFALLKSAGIFVLALGGIVIGSKYFGKVMIEEGQYNSMYLSKDYMYYTVAYKIPEYVPKTASYDYWQDIRKQEKNEFKTNYNNPPVVTGKNLKITDVQQGPFVKKASVQGKGTATLSVHYFPYWNIKVGDKAIKPEKFDKLGRPLIEIDAKEKTPITIQYSQSLIQKLANLITLATLGFLLVITFSDKVWRKVQQLTT